MDNIELYKAQSFKTYLADKLPKGIFKAVIAPRPIGWISSISKSGQHNIAPFSYFNAVCDNPPTVMIAMTNQHIENGAKDTLQNIEATNHFVINIVTHQLYKQMNLTSADLPRDKDEFEYAAIKWLESNFGKARRVQNSPIQLECKYYTSVQLPKGNHDLINRMVIGTVVAMHINPDILDENDLINYNKLQLIARMGYNDYLFINKNNMFIGQRPSTKSISEITDQ